MKYFYGLRGLMQHKLKVGQIQGRRTCFTDRCMHRILNTKKENT